VKAGSPCWLLMHCAAAWQAVRSRRKCDLLWKSRNWGSLTPPLRPHAGGAARRCQPGRCSSGRRGAGCPAGRCRAGRRGGRRQRARGSRGGRAAGAGRRRWPAGGRAGCAADVAGCCAGHLPVRGAAAAALEPAGRRPRVAHGVPIDKNGFCSRMWGVCHQRSAAWRAAGRADLALPRRWRAAHQPTQAGAASERGAGGARRAGRAAGWAQSCRSARRPWRSRCCATCTPGARPGPRRRRAATRRRPTRPRPRRPCCSCSRA